MIGVLAQGGDEIGLVDDGATGDVAYKSVLCGPEDGEFFGGKEVTGLLCEGDGDEEVVEILAEEVVQGGFVEAAEPRGGDTPVWIPRPRDNETLIAFRFRGRARGRRVREHVHAHCFSDAGGLPADGAVAQHAQALAGFVAHVAEEGAVGTLAPVVVALPVVQEGEVVRGGEHGHDDPFCDLGAVDAGAGGEGDGGVGVEGSGGDVVGAGADEVD